jgi:type IV secretory pathway VirB2 component (pilin)
MPINLRRFTVAVLTQVTLKSAHASPASYGMPWEKPADRLLSLLSAPGTRIMGTISLLVFGILLFAFSEFGSTRRRALSIVFFGLSGAFIVASLASWILSGC